MDVVILVIIKLVISALFQDTIQGRPCFYIMGKGDKLRDSICKGGGLVLCSINTVKEDWVIIFFGILKTCSPPSLFFLPPSSFVSPIILVFIQMRQFLFYNFF